MMFSYSMEMVCKRCSKFCRGDESKQDMNNRLENLLTRESIDADDVYSCRYCARFQHSEGR